MNYPAPHMDYQIYGSANPPSADPPPPLPKKPDSPSPPMLQANRQLPQPPPEVHANLSQPPLGHERVSELKTEFLNTKQVFCRYEYG